LIFLPSPVNAEITAAIIVSPTEGLFTDENGSTDSFSIALDSAPSNPVKIELFSGDISEGTVSPPSILFNNGNWDTVQWIDVTGVPDGIQDGDILYQIFGFASSKDLSFDGLEMPPVSITNINDALPIANDDHPPIEGYSPIIIPVLQNDIALDDTPLRLSVVSDPSNGSYLINPAPENTITYTPSPSFAGLDQFAYSVCDGDGDCATAKVIIEDQVPPTLVWVTPIGTGGIFQVVNEEISLGVEVIDNFQANCVEFLHWDAVEMVFHNLGNVCQEPYSIFIDSSTLNFAWNQIFAQASDLAGNLSDHETIWLYRWNHNYLPLLSR
jgi:hypothetical protein